MTPKALVVDDDKSMVRTLSDVLRLSGWDVTTAFSGSEAVQQAAGQAFDVVLMDVKMPGMDGVAAFKAMKATRPSIRVVLMTAYAEQALLAEAQREGAARIMPKPVDLASLLAIIAAQVQHRHPVLLVDHDAAFLQTLTAVLDLCGIETVVAKNVAEATALMESRRPMAVLLHMHLGDSATRAVVDAMHNAGPATALILYSGMPGANVELEQAIPAEWIHAYLQKPFAIDEVKRVLDAIP
ncbi:MAG: response regulator receiver protein [Gemmatimonadetes bacterium]|nr:response regulator receiver protein [Gemmatimonadota bacterium]